jgi:hypothetical protein
MLSNLEKIKDMIQKGDLKNASEQLLIFVNQNQNFGRFQNEAIGYKARLNQTFEKENKGIINDEETQIQKNRIMYAMLELIKELETEILNNCNPELLDILVQEKQDIISYSNIHQVQVIIQNTVTGDNISEKNMTQEKVVQIGDNANISAPIVIADSIQESFNILEKADVNKELKTQLDQLLRTVNQVSKQVTPEQTEIAQRMAQDAEILVKEAASSTPRRPWYELSLEGLQEAAKSIGEIAIPVLKTVGEISSLLLP